MKKGFRKHKITLDDAVNYEVILHAYGTIDQFCPSGACGFRWAGRWCGFHYDAGQFYAKPDEVKRIKQRVESEHHVSISRPASATG